MRSGGDDVAVYTRFDEIIGRCDLIGRDYGQPVCEPLVYDETPWFKERRHDQDVRLPV